MSPTTTTAPRTTAKHVGKGEAASLGRSRGNKAKVARNAAAVADLNDRAAAQLPSRVELIREAQSLGVEGPISRMKVKDLAAAIELKKSLAVTSQIEATEARRAAAHEANDGVEFEPAPASTGRGTERGRKARAAKKAGRAHRPASRKMTDDELVKYVKGVLKAHPDARRSDEHEYAYWVEGITHTADRFKAAWEAAGGA